MESDEELDLESLVELVDSDDNPDDDVNDVSSNVTDCMDETKASELLSGNFSASSKMTNGVATNCDPDKKTQEEENDLNLKDHLTEHSGNCFPSQGSLCSPLNKDQRLQNLSNNESDKSSQAGMKNEGHKIPARVLKDIPIDLFLDCNSTVSTSSTKLEKASSMVHTQDADSSDDENHNENVLTDGGKMIKKKIALHSSFDKVRRPEKNTWKNSAKVTEPEKATNSSGQKETYWFEEFSGLRIINPLVSHSSLKTRMVGRRMIKMSCIKNFMKNGDIEGDWVTIGVLVNKLPPKTSKNGKTYSIWKMCDLLDTERFVSFFLFGEVHAELWKTAVGTVIGILNPSFLPDQGSSKSSDLAVSVDHPGKIMLIGTSKDFGTCKSRRNDGNACTAVVNKSQCEYCMYHVSKEYKKFSVKRAELQGALNNRHPSLKSRALKGQNIIYGGQMYSSPTGSSVKTRNGSTKDKLILNSLQLKRKAEELDREEQYKVVKKKISERTEIKGKTAAETNFIDQQLAVPSAGSRNLLQYFGKNDKPDKQDKKAEKERVMSVTPKELLKMHEQQVRERQKKSQGPECIRNSSQPLQNFEPRIGSGSKPGDDICLEISPLPRKRFFAEEIAKLRAVKKIREKGPIQKKDPNAVRSKTSPQLDTKIKKIVEKSTEVSEGPSSEEVKGLLGGIDISSDRIKKALERETQPSCGFTMGGIVIGSETYFGLLEKKEQMEEKMLSTTEIVCNVVSCMTCKYTAHQASELCKNESHPLKRHKAVKKFFRCTECGWRISTFTKLPKTACRNCGSSSFEKTAMMKPRSGPKLGNETLLIRGEEVKFLNSLKS